MIKDDLEDKFILEEEEEEELEDPGVENPKKGEDETEENGSTDDSQEDESGEKETSKSEFKKQFTQIKGDTPEEYLKNLEQAYLNSSKEGQKLNEELKKIRTKVDGGEEAGDGEETKSTGDPILDEIIQERKAQRDQQFDEFVGEHPELQSDASLRKRTLNSLDHVFSAAKANGETLNLQQAMARAFVLAGGELSPSELAARAKQSASAGSPANSSSGKKSGGLTDSQKALMKKWGITEDQYKESHSFAKKQGYIS